MHIKATVPGTEDTLTWTPGDLSSSTFVPQEDCKPSRWYLRHCAPGWDTLRPGDRRKNAVVFIWLTFSLNSKSFTYIFPLLMKRVVWKWNLRQSVRVQTQIVSYLNKVSINIQSLSLLIGSDRWQATWTLTSGFSATIANGADFILSISTKQKKPTLLHRLALPLKQTASSSETICYW